MNNIKEIKIGFENCEVCTLSLSMFEYLVIKGIKEDIAVNCYQDRAGEFQTYKTCEEFSINILENVKMDNEWSELTLYDKLKFEDITSIDILYDDGKTDIIYVPWCDEDDFRNKWQENVYEKDRVIIKIHKIR